MTDLPTQYLNVLMVGGTYDCLRQRSSRRWGPFPLRPEELEAWPGFVPVTNVFMDVSTGPAVPSAPPLPPPPPAPIKAEAVEMLTESPPPRWFASWRATPEPEPVVTYSYVTGSYNFYSCTDSRCGQTQARSVTCYEHVDGSITMAVSDAYCSGTKPSTTGSTCPACVTYGYVEGFWNFETCDDNLCGLTQERTVTCKGSDGNTYDNSMCSGTMPSTRGITCAACPTYVFVAERWISPSGAQVTSADSTDDTVDNCPCDEVLTRNVVCTEYTDSDASLTERTSRVTFSDDQVLADTVCEEVGSAKPPESYQCRQCGYAWTPTEWSPSSAQCECFSTQTRDVECRHEITGEIADEAFCGAFEPATTQECDKSGCVRDTYRTGAWEPAQCSCAYTELTRVVECVDQYGRVKQDSACTAEESPPASTQRCPQCTYRWNTGFFTDCACGENKTRTVECLARQSDEWSRISASLEENVCPMSTKPAASEICDWSNREGICDADVGGYNDRSGAFSSFVPLFPNVFLAAALANSLLMIF